MRISELLAYLIKDTGTKKADIARSLNKTFGGLDSTLRSNSPQLDSLIDIAHQLGYDVCLMKHRDSGRHPDGLFVIDRGDSIKKIRGIRNK